MREGGRGVKEQVNVRGYEVHNSPISFDQIIMKTRMLSYVDGSNAVLSTALPKLILAVASRLLNFIFSSSAIKLLSSLQKAPVTYLCTSLIHNQHLGLRREAVTHYFVLYNVQFQVFAHSFFELFCLMVMIYQQPQLLFL